MISYYLHIPNKFVSIYDVNIICHFNDNLWSQFIYRIQTSSLAYMVRELLTCHLKVMVSIYLQNPNQFVSIYGKGNVDMSFESYGLNLFTESKPVR